MAPGSNIVQKHSKLCSNRFDMLYFFIQFNNLLISGTIGQGVFMVALAYSGCNYTLAVVFLSAAIAMNGSVSTGPLASIVDISPNYASKLYVAKNVNRKRTRSVLHWNMHSHTWHNKKCWFWRNLTILDTILSSSLYRPKNIIVIMEFLMFPSSFLFLYISLQTKEMLVQA